MKCKFIVLGLVLMNLFIFTACGSHKISTIIEEKSNVEKKKHEKMTILGFSQIGDESMWRTANTNSIKQAAKEAGIQLIFNNAEQRQENQINAIRSFIVKKVDVIAFSPVVEDGWDSILSEAKDAAIPVIVIDRSIQTNDQTLYKTMIGSDFLEEGKNASRWLISKFDGTQDNNNNNINSVSNINIVEIRGTDGSAPAVERKRGFEEILSQYPKFQIIRSENGDFLRSKGKEVMQSIMATEQRKIDVVFAHNDDMALGAIKAIEEYGKKPGEDIKVVSVDATRDAFEYMLQGKLDCTVECNPMFGEQLMEIVKKTIRNDVIPERIYISESVYTKDMAKDYINSRKY